MIKHEYMENVAPVNSEQIPIIAIIVTALGPFGFGLVLSLRK
jgi:hypothetical protein